MGSAKYLGDFLSEHQDTNPGNNRGLYIIILAIASGTKEIAKKLSCAGANEILGESGNVNMFGDQVKKIDDFADYCLTRRILETGQAAFVFSEEREVPALGSLRATLGVFIDPLDGSKESQTNITCGSIFSVYQRGPDWCYFPDDPPLVHSCDQICAGYALYGPATVLVLAFQDGVYEFVWDRNTSGEFIVTSENIKMPQSGTTYSANEAYSLGWDVWLRDALDVWKRRGYSSRYVGALVADFHRILKEGGVFLYPATNKKPDGKLRLFYEAAPMAFIAKVAGGLAIDGRRPPQAILDIKADKITERTPLIVGSRENVEFLISFLTRK